MENRLSGHTIYRTEYHVVWIPKYRKNILNPGIKSYLEKAFPGILRKLPGVEILEQNIQRDHIHMVMVIPPKYSVSVVMGIIKGRTASLIRRKYTWLDKVYSLENCVWSPGYFVSTVGLNEYSVMNYVKYQQSQDLGQAKLDL